MLVLMSLLLYMKRTVYQWGDDSVCEFLKIFVNRYYH